MAVWTKIGCTTSGSKISGTGITSRCLTYQSFNVRMGEYITGSCDFKSSEIRKVYIRFGNTIVVPSPWAIFDCFDGTLISKSVDCVASIRPLTDGWYRATIRTSVPFVNTGPKKFEIGLLGDSDTSPTANVEIPLGHGLFAKRPQAEIGTKETSYQQVTDGIKEFGMRFSQKVNDDYAPRAMIIPLGRDRRNKFDWSSDITKPNWSKGNSGSFSYSGGWSSFEVSGSKTNPEGFGIPLKSDIRTVSFFVKKTSDSLKAYIRDGFGSGSIRSSFTFNSVSGTVSSVTNPISPGFSVSVSDEGDSWRVSLLGIVLPAGSRKFLRIETLDTRGSASNTIVVRGFQGEIANTPTELQDIRSGKEFSGLTRRNMLSESVFSYNVPSPGATNGSLMFYGVSKSASGTSIEFIGKNVDDNTNECADLRVFGNASTAGKLIATWNLGAQVQSSSDRSYTGSVDVSMIYGEGLRNILLAIDFLDENQNVIDTAEEYVSASSLNRNPNRFSVTGNAPNGSVKALFKVSMEALQGDFDFILRVAAPQVEEDIAASPYQKVINEYHITEAGTISGWALVFDGIDDHLYSEDFDPGLRSYRQIFAVVSKKPNNDGVDAVVDGMSDVKSISVPVDSESLKGEHFLATVSPSSSTFRTSNSEVVSEPSPVSYDETFVEPMRLGGDGGVNVDSFNGILGPIVFRASSIDMKPTEINDLFKIAGSEIKSS